MRLRWKKAFILFGAFFLLLVAGVITFYPPIQWRSQLVARKLGGRLPELDWHELFNLMKLNNPVLHLGELLETNNLHRSIQNSYTTKDDLASGSLIYRSQCSRCHGADGAGAVGPELKQRVVGSSDWTLFKTISRGVPNTAMPGLTLPEKSIWQTAAFVRSLGSGSKARDLPGTEPVASPQVSYDRLLKAQQEPANWLSYSGSYASHRFGRLPQINRRNVKQLRPEWVFQMSTTERIGEASPLVVGDVMYLTEPPNNVLALDAGTGQLLFSYKRQLPPQSQLCCGRINRGLAILDDTLYLGTLDSHLVALDARTGAVLWDVEVADLKAGYSITSAPLAVKDKIIVGIAGGENGIRGFLDAYNAKTGQREWRFATIPAPGEPGNETWAGDSWKTGGGGTWLTGSFDPELNLIYWGVGNPGPPFQGEGRHGDNLYSNCVIALDADTGKLRWHFQFVPHDLHDLDAVQIPVLLDANFRGEMRKLMLWASQNAFFYVLDRKTGEFLVGREFARQNWAKGLDANGRPVTRPESAPTPAGTLVYPGSGATNWWSPSYSPVTGLFYVPVWENACRYFSGPAVYSSGDSFNGSTVQDIPEDPGYTAVRALTALTGELKWEYVSKVSRTGLGGILSTAGDLVFWGADHRFLALDAYDGKELWRFNTGAEIMAAPITYLSKGKQRVTVCSGRSVFTFAVAE